MRKWVFPRQFSNGAQTSCTHTVRIGTVGRGGAAVDVDGGGAKNSVREKRGAPGGRRGSGGQRKNRTTAVLMNAATCIYIYIFVYVYTYTCTRARANITSPLHISNLISHMHNRKFPVPRTRTRRPSHRTRGGISFQFLSHRTTVELFLPLVQPNSVARSVSLSLSLCLYLSCRSLSLSLSFATRQTYPVRHGPAEKRETQQRHIIIYYKRTHLYVQTESILDKWAAAVFSELLLLLLFILY